MINSYANTYGLRTADVVVTPKSSMKIVEHYAIYMERHNGVHWYIENNNMEGVRWITESFFMQDNPTLLRIRKFEGNEWERQLAFEKAKGHVGTRYNLRNFNCEHLANTVQYNQSFSKQVSNVGIVAVAGLFFAAVGWLASSEE